MAKIPQYTRSVAPQNTPYEYITSNANPEAFGVGVSSAVNNLGKAVSGFADTITELKNQYDRTKVVELSNYLDQWTEDTLYNKENGYLYKTGKDAMGKTPEMLNNYDKYADELISKYGFMGINEAQARDIIQKRRINLAKQISQHDRNETDRWQATVYSDKLTNIFNNAIKSRNNPQDLDMFLKDGITVLDNFALIKGWNNDPEMLSIKRKEFEAAFHGQVLDAYLAEGSLKAGEYFEKNKDKFSPDMQNKYTQKIHSEEINYKARATAESLIFRSTEDVFKYINGIEDIDLRNAVVREYSFLKNQQETIRREANEKKIDSISQQLSDMFNNGGNPNDMRRAIMTSDLPFEAKKKYIDLVDDYVEYGQKAGLWTEKATLDNMIATDFERFQKEDLSKYQFTSKDEYEHYKKIKDKVIEYNTEKNLEDMFQEVDTKFNWNRQGLDNNAYKNDILYVIARMERLQGKAFNPKNIDTQVIIDSLNYKAQEMPDELKKVGVKNFGNVDETKEVIARSLNIEKTLKNYNNIKFKYDVKDALARKYVNFKHENKREPNPEEFYGMAVDIYSNLARANYQQIKYKADNLVLINDRIKNTKVTQKGYTPVLTYFVNDVIPQWEAETGVKIKVTSTYRPNGKYGHEKGMKIDIFPENPTPKNIRILAEKCLESPVVARVFTSSNPVAIYNGNKKLDYWGARKYDKTDEAKRGKITHTNHFDLTLSTQFGGTRQLK